MRQLFWSLEFWNYTFHPMRMTDTILPGHTSPGSIKGSANHARPLFSFPPCWHQVETSRHEREHSLSIPGRFQTAERVTFHLERAHFNICSSVSFGKPFLVNYLSLQMDPEASGWVLNSCTAIYNCPPIFFNSQYKGKLLNWKPSISTPSVLIFYLLI